MNDTKRLTDRVGFVLRTAILGVLTGCTTYVEQPRPRATYQPEPPHPREVYAPPPPAVNAPPPTVEVNASVGVGIRAESDFYAPLTPYGRWEVVGSYGRCWIPGRVEARWRPYCNGYWQRTDAGWYWESDEPWAWATYHYGRWDFSPQFGWYWVPQTQWAPAWVSWHEGGGYVGWAPLHPSARISVSGSVDVNVALISPRAFVFVEQRRFLEPVRPATVVVNNTTVINKTVNITNTKVVNKTVINEGPRTEVVERASGRKVQAVPVRELRRKHEAEVVARQRIASPGRENQDQAEKLEQPDRSKAEPAGQTSAPAREQRQIEKPGVTAREPPAPAPNRRVREIDEQNRATKLAHEEQQRQRKEQGRAVEEQKRATKAAEEQESRAKAPAAPAASARAREIEQQNGAAKLAHEEQQRQRKEQGRAVEEQKRATKAAEEQESRAKPPAAPASSTRAREIEEQNRATILPQEAAKQAQKQADRQDKRVEEVKKGAQRQVERRTRQEQAANEEARKKAAKKDRKKQVEEQQTPPLRPADSP